MVQTSSDVVQRDGELLAQALPKILSRVAEMCEEAVENEVMSEATVVRVQGLLSATTAVSSDAEVQDRVSSLHTLQEVSECVIGMQLVWNTVLDSASDEEKWALFHRRRRSDCKAHVQLGSQQEVAREGARK